MSDNLTKIERKAAFSLGCIFSFRMLGLFMILPVFSIYAGHLAGATPVMIGVALGIYGLVQACLQIPFGMLSDHIGRKPVIALGLGLFAIGSVVAALSHSMLGIIVGRALQGSGAIGSTIIALMADLTDEAHRARAMAMIGMCIGLSFTLAIVLGPMLAHWGGLAAIFWLTAGLACLGLIVLFGIIPTPVQSVFQNEAEVEPTKLFALLRNTELLRLDFGIFVSHAMLTATFLVLPLVLQHSHGGTVAEHGLFYLPILIVSFICMVPFVIIAEKKRKMKPLFLAAIMLTLIAQGILVLGHRQLSLVVVGLFIYFVGFNFLEASLPSLIAKAAPAGSKGSAMGIYSSAQFFGIFVGGAGGGVLLQHAGISGVFISCAGLAIVWLLVACAMAAPRYLSTKVIKVRLQAGQSQEQLRHALLQITGIADALVVAEHGVAHLKVDKALLDESALQALTLN